MKASGRDEAGERQESKRPHEHTADRNDDEQVEQKGGQTRKRSHARRIRCEQRSDGHGTRHGLGSVELGNTRLRHTHDGAHLPDAQIPRRKYRPCCECRCRPDPRRQRRQNRARLREPRQLHEREQRERRQDEPTPIAECDEEHQEHAGEKPERDADRRDRRRPLGQPEHEDAHQEQQSAEHQGHGYEHARPKMWQQLMHARRGQRAEQSGSYEQHRKRSSH
jgi:hypothetical protein